MPTICPKRRHNSCTREAIVSIETYYYIDITPMEEGLIVMVHFKKKQNL